MKRWMYGFGAAAFATGVMASVGTTRMAATTGSEECIVSAATEDQSVRTDPNSPFYNGRAAYEAATNTEDCSNSVTRYVEGTILDAGASNIQCPGTGVQKVNDWCIRSSTTTPATVHPEGPDGGCGTMTGISNHKFEAGGWYYTTQGENRVTGLDMGSCDRNESCESTGTCNEECPEGMENCEPSPIVIAMENSAYQFTTAADGVNFDIDADGVVDHVSWTKPDTEVAFLAWDRNHNGVIDDGRELFGNHTVPGVFNGFDALRILSGSTTGLANADVPFFAELQLWTDRNHNGFSEASELVPASSGLADIGLAAWPSPRKDGHGNEFRLRGFAHVRTAPGRNLPAKHEDKVRGRAIFDVWFDVVQ